MLASRLFEALADRETAPDAELPATGIDRERERLLSPAFIRTPDGRYGTRCSTVVVTERVKRQLVTHIFERTFTPGQGVALLRRARLADWPPRYTDRSHDPVEVSAVAESELGMAAQAAVPVKRTRVRTLLKPARRSA